MNRHPTDLLALLFGFAFAIAGGLVLVTQATDLSVSPQWATAVALIALGTVAMVAAAARGLRDDSPRDGAMPPGDAPAPRDRATAAAPATAETAPVSPEDAAG